MIVNIAGVCLALVLLIGGWPASTQCKKSIPIGAIFDRADSDAEMAFRHAIVRENMFDKRHTFEPMVRYVDPADSWLAERTACSLAAEGVIAIFGPCSVETSNIVASVCADLGLPHIIAHATPIDAQRPASQPYAEPPPIRPTPPSPGQRRHALTRNFYPAADALGTALAQIVADYDWPTFTLIYQHREALDRLHDVLQLHGPGDQPVTVRQLSTDGDDLPLLKAVRTSGVTHIVLDCDMERVLDVMGQARQVQLLAEYQSFVLTSLDAHLVDFGRLWPESEDGDSVRPNVTAVRVMAADSGHMETAVFDWNGGEQRMGWGANEGNTSDTTDAPTRVFDAEHVSTEAALWHDAMHMFAATVRQMGELRRPQQMRCSGEGGRRAESWEQGLELVHQMDLTTEYGLTGRIVFDGDRDDTDDDVIRPPGRIDFYLDILELTVRNTFEQIATWTLAEGVQTVRTEQQVETQISESLQSKEIIVSSRLGEPYLRERRPVNGEILTGNDRYEGFSMDLIQAIADRLKFRFRFELVADKQYGSLNAKTKKWNGLVKELLDRKADLAICDLTITFERRTAVDFTIPFMSLGVSILYTKPKKENPSLFKMLEPLSVSLWMHMATAFLVVAIVQFVLAKFAADDWENPNPSDPDPECLETIWSLENCIWLATGSIMQQGCDLLPKASSTRLVCGLWWFFTLIVIQSYIANMAAVLTKDRSEETIKNADDLSRQSRIKYGAVIGGSTLGFFKESNISTYQRMWSTMDANAGEVLVRSNQEGEERVAKGGGSYAFLMESSSIAHICNRNCNLTQVGGLMDSKGYGIAMPMNSPYRTHINRALLKLQEQGKLQELRNQWWRSETGDCPPEVEASDELDMSRLGGVFFLLVAGLVVAVGIAMLEFLWHVRQVAIRQKVSLWPAFRKEMLFVLDLRQTNRPNFLLEETPTRSIGGGNSARSYEMDEWMADD